jgi:hypothetical protein
MVELGYFLTRKTVDLVRREGRSCRGKDERRLTSASLPPKTNHLVAIGHWLAVNETDSSPSRACIEQSNIHELAITNPHRTSPETSINSVLQGVKEANLDTSSTKDYRNVLSYGQTFKLWKAMIQLHYTAVFLNLTRTSYSCFKNHAALMDHSPSCTGTKSIWRSN